MTLLIEWALQPMGMVALALLLTLISWLIKGAKPLLPFSMFCISALLFFTLSMPSIANALVYQLENARHNPAFCNTQIDLPIVVLGGGIDLYVNSESPYELLNANSLVRTIRATEFGSVNTQYYLLGGGNSERSLAANMKKVLIDLNIDPDKITVETRSKSTFENANALQVLLPATNNKTIVLATSRLHVKRAAATFEKAGYQVCHVNIDTIYSKPKPPVSLLPYLSGLAKSTRVFHEWMAWFVYQTKGYL